MTNEEIIAQQFERVGFAPADLVITEVRNGGALAYSVRSVNEKHLNEKKSPAAIAVVASVDPDASFADRALNSANTLKAFISAELGEFA